MSLCFRIAEGLALAPTCLYVILCFIHSRRRCAKIAWKVSREDCAFRRLAETGATLVLHFLEVVQAHLLERTDACTPNLACDARSVTAAAPVEPSSIGLGHVEAHPRSRCVPCGPAIKQRNHSSSEACGAIDPTTSKPDTQRFPSRRVQMTRTRLCIVRPE